MCSTASETNRSSHNIDVTHKKCYYTLGQEGASLINNADKVKAIKKRVVGDTKLTCILFIIGAHDRDIALYYISMSYPV